MLKPFTMVRGRKHDLVCHHGPDRRRRRGNVAILQAPSKDYVIAAFEAELMEEDPDNEGEIIVNAVIQCDTEPKRV